VAVNGRSAQPAKSTRGEPSHARGVLVEIELGVIEVWIGWREELVRERVDHQEDVARVGLGRGRAAENPMFVRRRRQAAALAAPIRTRRVNLPERAQRALGAVA
jgi:hypothetical protein